MKVKEIKIGLLTLISLIVAYLGFNYLKGSDLIDEGMTYHAVYKNVDGLHVGSKVVLNGLPIGR